MKRVNNWFGLRRRSTKSESGYTLLEYCAGAAVVLTVVWGALQALGTNMSNMLDGIADWAGRREADIRNLDAAP